MTIFTSEENKPTEFTLRLIRQMAYTYRVARILLFYWYSSLGGERE